MEMFALVLYISCSGLVVTAEDFELKGRKIEFWWKQANFSLYIYR